MVFSLYFLHAYIKIFSYYYLCCITLKRITSENRAKKWQSFLRSLCVIKALLLAAVCRISPQCEQKQQVDLRSVWFIDSGAGFSSQGPGAEGFSKPRILLSSALRMRSIVKAELFLSMASVAGSEPECGRVQSRTCSYRAGSLCCLCQTPIYQID